MKVLNNFGNALEETPPELSPEKLLELVAVLETEGTTDAIAVRQGASDVFDLAQRRAKIKKEPTPPTLEAHSKTTPVFLRKRVMYWRGPLMVWVMVLVLISLNFYQFTLQRLDVSSWSITLGMVSGIILSGGLLQVLGWRLSMLYGKDSGHPRRVLILAGMAAGLGIVLLSVVLVEGILYLSNSTFSNLWGFGLSCGGIAILQLLGGILVLLKRQIHMVLGFSAGLGLTWVLNLLWLGQFDGIITVVLGYLLIFTILGGLLALALYRLSRQSPKKEALFLPPRSQFMYKALPFLAYGVLSVTYVVIGQFGGWFSQLPTDWTRSQAIEALSIVHILGLSTVLLTQGVAEVALTNFWPFINHAQNRLRFDHCVEIKSEARHYIKSHLKDLLVIQVLLATALGLSAFFIWKLAGLEQTLGQLLPAQLILSLFSYGLLTWGLFIAGLLITVSHTWIAVRAFLAAIAVEVIGSLLLNYWFGFEASILAMVVGGVCLVVLTQRKLNSLLNNADYLLYQAF